MLFLKRNKKIGLALGGGAARGIAHIGVIKGLIKHKIPIHYIAGTSSGSMVGGLFSAGLNIDYMIEEVQKLTWRDFAGIHLSRQGLVSSKPIELLVQKLVGKKKFKNLIIPFSAVGTDILTGESILLNDPDLELALAIRASSSFPGVYPPLKIGKTYVIDGSAAGVVPSQVVRQMGATVVISVDVIPHHVKIKRLPLHLATITDRGLDLLLANLARLTPLEADVVLRPVTEAVHSFQFKKAYRLIELGMAAVENKIDEIKAAIA